MANSLAAEINAAARLEGDFLLRSGRRSTTYFDKYRFESDPALLRRIAERMLTLMPDGADALVGLELGGVPIATAMALLSGRRVLFCRKTAKAYGTCQALEGGEARGLKVVLVEDVITTGGAVAEAVEHVRAAGGEVIGVVCAIWRGEGAPQIRGLEGLPVLAAVTRSELDASAVILSKGE